MELTAIVHKDKPEKMKIVINNNRKIFALQEEFNAVFPGLTLDFHAKPSKPGGAPSEKLVGHSSKTLEECRVIHNEGTVEILPSMHVSDVQNIFRDIFGLSVEILQKAGDGTRVNPGNDKLTVAEINRQYSA
jgi:hypothetical protein